MLLVIPREFTVLPEHKALFEQMSKFNDSMREAGIILDLNGLMPPSQAAQVTFKNGKASVVDGPFAEAKETVGGYWIIQVKSRDEAIEWARRAPMLDGDRIEVRRVSELSDFPAEIQAVAR
jgi:hypothetical protein